MSLSRYCIILLLACSTVLLHAEDGGEDDFSLDSLLAVPVSTAAKYRQTVAEAPASISVITSAEIERYHYRTLADVLNRVRGIYITSDRNYTYAGVRGFARPSDNNDRILLLIDGHTFNENVYGSGLVGSEFGISLDAVERIEIVRGPGSALYGTGAMFGVVNVITKDYKSMDGLRAAGSLGSYGQRNAALAYGTEITHGSGVFVSANFGRQDGTGVYFPEYDAVETNRGIASDVDWDTYYGITAKVTLPFLVIQSGFTSREKGIPTASYFSAFNDPRAQTKDMRQFADILYTAPLRDALQCSLRLYGDRYYYAGVYPYDILSEDESTGKWWGSEARVQWDIASNDRFVIGGEYQDSRRSDYKVWNGGIQSFNRDEPFSVISAYAQNEFQWFENLSLTTGIRYDHHSASGGFVSPRLAVNWNVTEGGVLKVLGGRAFRMPNFYELYYADPLSGFKDNPSLTPEYITTWELAFDQRITSTLHASASVYAYTMRDLIDQDIDPADSLLHFQNRSETTAYGMELEIEYQTQDLRCYGIVSTQRARNTLTDERLTNSPAWLVRAGASYTINAFMDASFEGSHDSRRRTVYGTTTSPFTLVHARVNITAVPEHLKFSVGVRDLFNVRYTVPGGFEHLQLEIPQPGREITLTATISL